MQLTSSGVKINMALLFCLCLAVSVVFGLPEDRIVGGEDAAPGEFPAIVSLQVDESHNCGANVLDEQWLLTAAHCVDVDTSQLSVLAGTVNISSGGTRHRANKVVVHSRYSPEDSWVNDVALIRVEPALLIDNVTVAAARLPEQWQDTPAGTPAVIIGWGRLWQNGDLPDMLQKVDTAIVDQQECFDVYAYNYTIHDSQICSEVPLPDKGACNGDSGSPMLVDGVVVGLASWQQGCALEGYPTVYTRVSHFVDWIEENKK
ncbi:mite allergen Der p 3-like [Schistocerca nitens]|uniref:mite allergen Der p 3-like n=1 Tax=Schistocerca nitens TaxID=7011 RepID=UPI0021190992|nr:mite allergen Der p 3-like [Schistocerca nitens]